jgi:polyferredoxin
VRRHNILFYIAASGLVSLSFSSLVLAASLNDTASSFGTTARRWSQWAMLLLTVLLGIGGWMRRRVMF